MELIIWIIFGGMVGWIASVIMHTDDQQGIIINIIVGIAGASLGGYLMQMFGQSGVTGFNIYSFLVAIFGSALLIYIIKLIRA